MQVVILAGGYGTRLSEETQVRPKPMVEIGGQPLLWHLMKLYSTHGLRDFIICLGYKGHVIQEYFADYSLHASDVTFDLERDTTEVHRRTAEPWKVTLVDTGEKTETGGRLKRIREYLDPRKPFCFAYGDCLADVNVTESIAFHERERRPATVTVARPPARFGSVDLAGSAVVGFREKAASDAGWVNAGFFVLSTSVIDLIEGDATTWEREPLERLANENALSAFVHHGFWQPVDTLRDKNYVEGLWASGRAPWKVW